MQWYMSLKYKIPDDETFFSRRHSCEFSSLLIHIQLFTVHRVFSDLRYRESLLKSVIQKGFTLNKMSTQFLETLLMMRMTGSFWNGSLLGRAEALMYYEVSPQPSSLESFSTAEKIHIERWRNDLTAEITVESSPSSYSPAV